MSKKRNMGKDIVHILTYMFWFIMGGFFGQFAGIKFIIPMAFIFMLLFFIVRFFFIYINNREAMKINKIKL